MRLYNRKEWINKAKDLGVNVFLLLFLMSVSNLWVMHLYFALMGYIEYGPFIYSYVTNFCTVIIDISIVMFVFLCLSQRRLRISLYLTFFLTLIWSFCNVFYGRFFYHYLTISAVCQSGGVTDAVVIKSIIAGFQWSDLYYLISLSSFIFIVVRLDIKEVRLSWKKSFCILSLPIISLLIILFVYSTYHFIKPETRGNQKLYDFKVRQLIINPTKSRNTYLNEAYFNAGVVRTIFSELNEIIYPYELTKEQRFAIIREYKQYDQRSTDHTVNPQVKNIVFILLESFLSASSDLFIDGKQITPFLDSLKHADDTYYNGFVHPNITCGESGDGQFILMTGILPMRSKYVVGEAKNNTIPFALPKVLKKHMGINHAEIILPSSLFVWQQENMNKVYGFNHCYSKLQVKGNQGENLTDEIVFKLSTETDKIKNQPFFSMVLSISTHLPYNEIVDPDFVLNDSSVPQGYKIYLNTCHFADTQIKKYIEHLRKEGVYDNTLIIITSDHHTHIDAIGMEGKITTDLPLYIINGNIDKLKAYSGSCNQLDVYTTILDVLGIHTEWRGLGHTLLNGNYQNSVSSTTYDLSEQIIMSDFFKKNK